MENVASESETETTKSTITIIFDKLDWIDYTLYGKRLKVFLLSSIFVVLLAPLLDAWLDPYKDKITAVSTALYLILIIVFLVSWISAWRDDDGNWTRQRAWYRIKSYGRDSQEFYVKNKNKSSEELFYRIGLFLVLGSICLKAMQNASVLYRHTIGFFGDFRMKRLRNFESFSNHYFLYFLVAGFLVLIYLFYKNPIILNKLINEFKTIFGKTQAENQENGMGFNVGNSVELIVDSKDKIRMGDLGQKNNSEKFNTFLTSMEAWDPKGCTKEYEFQEKLKNHLRKHFPNSIIETEFPLKDEVRNIRRRADIVIDKTILLELKRNPSAGEMDRAKSQIDHYSELWKGKGPVILVTCHLDIEHVQKHFATRMSEMIKLDKNVMAIVVQKNK